MLKEANGGGQMERCKRVFLSFFLFLKILNKQMGYVGFCQEKNKGGEGKKKEKKNVIMFGQEKESSQNVWSVFFSGVDKGDGFS